MEACLAMLLRTPPGQLKNTMSDIQGILSEKVPKSSFMEQAQPWLERHSHDQLSTVSVQLGDETKEAIVCPQAKIGDVYWCPRLSCTFVYDHSLETVKDVTSCARPTHEAETLRAAVDQQLAEYVYSHYMTGTSIALTDILPEHLTSAAGATNDAQVPNPQDENHAAATAAAGQAVEGEAIPTDQPFVADDPPPSETAPSPTKADDTTDVPASTDDAEGGVPGLAEPATTGAPVPAAESTPALEVRSGENASPRTLTIHIVGNKYNLRNFWAGRWRSTYTYDLADNKFTQASIKIHTHYFENGNVQMHTQHDALPEAPRVTAGASLPAEIVAAVAAHEQAYQQSLFDTLDTLRDRAFKALRRTLPVTRQKVDWDKAVGYQWGSELARRAP